MSAMHVVEHNGVHIHVRDDGEPSGRPIIFANSLGSDLRVWDPLLPHLPAGFRFIRWDKRGHGLSDTPPAPYSIADHVGDMGAVMDALNATEGAVAIGLSIGGQIVQGLAAARADQLAAIALLDTAAKLGDASAWNARIEAIEKGGVAAVADMAMERWFPPSYRESEPALAIWRNMVLRTPDEGYIGSCAALRDSDLTDFARTIRKPTLCVVGSEDLSTPPEIVRGLADLIPGSEYVEMPGVGHIPCAQEPEALARILVDFLTKHGLA